MINDTLRYIVVVDESVQLKLTALILTLLLLLLLYRKTENKSVLAYDTCYTCVRDDLQLVERFITERYYALYTRIYHIV